MPIETDHPAPWGRVRYRFHPWYERPLTERQVRILLVACWSAVAVPVAIGGIAIWLAGWPIRWIVEPIVVAIIALLSITCRDARADLPTRAEPWEGQ